MLSFSLRVLTVGIVLTGTALALDDDQQRALDVHNSMRSWRGLEQLWWDDGLAWEAQQWADQLGYMGTLEHSSGGENLYMQSWSSDDALTRAAQTWLDEMYSYNDEYIPDGDFQSYGHYSEFPNSAGCGPSALTKGGGQPRPCGGARNGSAWALPRTGMEACM